MKVLITGAFGNIGQNTIKELMKKGVELYTFDLKNKKNYKIAKKYKKMVKKMYWGDIRKYDDVFNAVSNKDVVVHLAAIIPPLSERQPELAYDVNVNGTKNIVEAIKNSEDSEGLGHPKLVFTSSVSIYGARNDREPPLRIDSEIQPSDNYSRHKVECERIIRASGVEWTVLRLGAVPPVDLSVGFDPIMFEINLDNRIEFVDGEDVALALSNATELLFNSEINNKVFLIGGGKENGCQLYYRDFVNKMLEAYGVGKLPDRAFGKKPYYTDWMDTSESQKILRYQRHSFKGFIGKIKKVWGVRRVFVRAFYLIAQLFLLSKSPYYKSKKADKN
ncbi:MAG: NAD-dependent epimerase/dehydratase family protein [Promethearchaeota archaeon]